MRIALLIGTRGPDDGALRGTAAYVVSLAVGLDEREHEVHVFRAAAVRRSEYSRLGDVHYHVVSTDSRSYAPNAVTESLTYYIAETQGIAGPFDVVHAHNRTLLPALDVLKTRAGARAFLTLHSDSGLSSRNEVAKDPHWNLLSSIDGIMASSRALGEKISDRLRVDAASVATAYSGIDLKKYSRLVDPRKVKESIGCSGSEALILFVGELTRHLGPDLLLEATFDVLQQFPAVNLAFCGDGPLAPFLRDRSRVLGMSARVKLLGFVPEEQVIDLYNACDIVCVPARAARLEQTVLEAWCAGKPIVISQHCAPEFFEPFANGLATRPDVDAVAEDLLLCLRQGDVAANFGREAWQKVDSMLSWTAVARLHEQIYENSGIGREAS